MGKNKNISKIPYYGELLDLLAEVHSSINGDYPQLKEKIRVLLEAAEPSKLHEEHQKYQ